MAGNGEILIHDDTALFVERHAETATEWRRGVACGPDHRPRRDVRAVLKCDTCIVQLLDLRIQPDLNAEIEELPSRTLR
jgi:hypothetical protein